MYNYVKTGDSLVELKNIAENSIDCCLTDVPYFIHGMDSDWNPEEVASKKNMKVVTSLRAGMVFDGKKQGKDFYDWYLKVSHEIFRVLKSGAFFFTFSSPRLYHRMACAVEDAGFDIRDQFIWLYTGQTQPKAMSLNHVIDRLKIPDEEKASLKEHLSGWKTPQVKSCHEPILMAQKPIKGRFLDNYLENGVGLVNTNVKIGDDMFPANVVSTDEMSDLDRYFLVSKPSKKEKGDFNTHKTVKPVTLLKYLICLSTREGAVVLDPFVGSGSTCVAAQETGRKYIGIDLNGEYVKIAEKRLSQWNHAPGTKPAD